MITARPRLHLFDAKQRRWFMRTGLERHQQRAVTPLGTVVTSGSIWCHVIGWGYASWDPDYESEPQIIVEKPLGTFVQAGVAIDLPTIENGEIPVYAEREGQALRRIIVDATRCVALGQPPPSWNAEASDRMRESDHVDLLGYVTIEGMAILITDYHLIRLTTAPPDDTAQIIDWEDPPLRVGVYVQLGEQDEGQQYPVYAEYQGDKPVRVIVDLAVPSAD